MQIRFSGTDSRELLRITSDFMEKLRHVPGAVDVGLSEQEPQNELRIELDRGLANTLGAVAARAAGDALGAAAAVAQAGCRRLTASRLR